MIILIKIINANGQIDYYMRANYTTNAAVDTKNGEKVFLYSYPILYILVNAAPQYYNGRNMHCVYTIKLRPITRLPVRTF